jgi:hypothetical protein
MQFLMLFNPDFSQFDPTQVARALRSCPEFKNLRIGTPVGTLIECEYNLFEESTTVRLSPNAERISLTGMSNASLGAALLIQKCLQIPLRIVNDAGTFDLTFSDIETVEELEAAMENARTTPSP